MLFIGENPKLDSQNGDVVMKLVAEMVKSLILSSKLPTAKKME